MTTVAEFAHQPTPCRTATLFKVDDDAPEGFVEQLDEYLSAFAALVRIDGKTHCFNCGEPFDGMMNMFGLAVAFEWGLAHGEGHCSGCGWPMRAHHFPKDKDGGDLVTIRGFPLAYMPEHVELRKAASA